MSATLRTGYKTYVPVSSITLLRGFGNYTHVIADKVYLSSKTMQVIQKQLYGFWRVSKSVAVNPECIASISRLDLMLTDGTRVDVARRRRRHLKRAIAMRTQYEGTITPELNAMIWQLTAVDL